MSSSTLRRRRRIATLCSAAAALSATLIAVPLAGGAAAATNLNLSVGGGTADGIEGQGFYAGVVTVRLGDTVTWKFKSPHTVNFYTAPGDPEAPGVGNGTFTGVNDPESSGIKVPAPGQDTYALTFASTGNFTYFCALHPGMAGLVRVVDVASPVASTTQAEADAAGAAQFAADLAAGAAARDAFTPTTAPGPGGGTLYNVANGIGDIETTTVQLAPIQTGGPSGTAVLSLTGTSLSVKITMTGLVPGAHPAHIHNGQCGIASPPKGAANDILFPLPDVVADATGVASLTTTVTLPAPPAIPANTWYVNVHTSMTDLSPVSCGNVVAHPASLLRFKPDPITIKAGDTVRWTMMDPREVHPLFFGPAAQEPANPFSPPSGGNTISSPTNIVVTGPQLPGSVFNLTFTGPGTYKYICMLHDEAGMVGTITVTAAEGLPPTGSSSGWLVALGVGLVGVGALTVLATRRRTRPTAV
jgi:plastocyanin